MRTLVVYGATIALGTASVYYLLRLASAKRDAAVKGELAVHNMYRLDGISLSPRPDLTVHPILFSFSIS
jgi:hypothetical protein